jgi:penicillin-binding protein 1A
MAKRSRPRNPRAKPSPKKQARRGARLRRFLLKWLFVLFIWAGVVGLGFLAYFAYDLPETDTLAGPARNPAVSVLAVDGTPIATYGNLAGDFVSIDEIPQSLVDAVIATEDRRFFDHFGIDLWGIIRAGYANLEAGRIVEGGSTITQQLAKISFLDPERTLKRKIQEAMLAIWLERKFTKDEILAIYLNRVYLGAGAYGVDAAAKRYFDKSARRLNLAEAALLAGLLKAPSRYAPTRNPELAAERATVVLNNMIEAGFLSPEEAEAASHGRATPGSRREGAGGARYFADWVLEQVAGYVGPQRGDLTVLTTLDPALQEAAQAALAGALAREGTALAVSQGALLALTPEGAVRAMVGGRDYGMSQFNRATQAMRQPGSAFKPIVYLAALEEGYTPAERVLDAPITVGDWSPRNYDDRYYGEVSLEEAFARSLNSAAVRLIRDVGVKAVIKMARRLGVTADLPSEATLSLGSAGLPLLELVQAYAAIPSGGVRVLAHGITEIRDSAGATIYRRQGSGAGRAVSGETVAGMLGLMAAVVETGTGRAARLEAPLGPAYGKTGTSQDFRDAWFVGFAGGLVTGVWLGNDDARAMNRVTGGTLPARLWQGFMTTALSCAPERFAQGCSWLDWTIPLPESSKGRNPEDRGIKSGKAGH